MINPPTKEFTEACKAAERRPVPGYEGFYEVSTLGEVFSLARVVQRSNGRPLNKRERLMKPGFTPQGYRTVTLSKDNVAKCFAVHSLVLATFVGPRPEGMHGCHGDNDKSNNALSNLRYDTPAGNNADKKRHGTQQIGETASNSKLTRGDVLEIRRRLTDGEKQRDIADDFNVSKGTIWAINTRKVWAHV